MVVEAEMSPTGPFLYDALRGEVEFSGQKGSLENGRELRSAKDLGGGDLDPVNVPRRRRQNSTAKAAPETDPISKPPRRKELVYFEDAPAVLQFNKYVRSGYRAGFTYSECAWSVFSTHNETGNIWSHLLPAVVIIMGLVTGLRHPWDGAEVPFFANSLSVVGCLLASVLYHTLMGCHCHYHRWLTLDVCGVYGVLLGSQWFVFGVGFACWPTVRFLAIAVYYSIAVVGVPSSLTAKSAKGRGMPMLLLLLVRLGLLATRPVLGSASMVAFRYYFLAEVVSFVGGVVNVLRLPECWSQPSEKRQRGVFDIWCNSHQIMHVCVFIGMVFCHLGMQEDAGYFRKPEAVCPA